MSEENKEGWEYIQAEDLIAKPTFKSSNKAGYVEEEVDQWAAEARTRFTELANDFNEAIHRLDLTEGELNETKQSNENLTNANKELMAKAPTGPTQSEYDALVAENKRLQDELDNLTHHYNEVSENYSHLHSSYTDSQEQLTAARAHAATAAAAAAAAAPAMAHGASTTEADSYTYHIETVNNEVKASSLEFPHLTVVRPGAEAALSELMDNLEDELSNLRGAGHQVPRPGEYEKPDAAVSSLQLDSVKVQAILDAASTEARDHILRTQEKMIRIEEAARREAEGIVADANREAEESRAELAHNKAESKSIRERMVMLLEAQLSEIQKDESAVGYSPRYGEPQN